ncbi:MAG: hypothetical protein R3277_10055 [Brumimicrobium sp.]|nr:hypothetical protein [Brumimicrobium sp.]
MENKLSIEDQIRSARENTLQVFKDRFRQKWLLGMPVFHWSELQLSESLKKGIYTSNPTIWILNNADKPNFDEVVWKEEDVERIISFDHIENAEIHPHDETFAIWLREDIECGLGLVNETDNQDLILVYSAGTGEMSEYWSKAFNARIERE